MYTLISSKSRLEPWEGEFRLFKTREEAEEAAEEWYSGWPASSQNVSWHLTDTPQILRLGSVQSGYTVLTPGRMSPVEPVYCPLREWSDLSEGSVVVWPDFAEAVSYAERRGGKVVPCDYFESHGEDMPEDYPGHELIIENLPAESEAAFTVYCYK